MPLVAVSAAEAVEFVSKHHYTGSAVPGVIRYGWEVDGRLVGVTIYDTGTHAVRSGVFGPDYFQHVLHHHRLALDPSAPKLSASEFIGASLREMRATRPDIWAVVTYADACRGHLGTIYQATNATYTVEFAKGNLEFRTKDGRFMTTQSLSRFGTWPERRAEAAQRGWTEIRCEGKHRYVYLLGTKMQQRWRPPMLWPTLPAPKPDVTKLRCSAPGCVASVRQPATGRPRRFCSGACRVRAHRQTRSHAA